MSIKFRKLILNGVVLSGNRFLFHRNRMVDNLVVPLNHSIVEITALAQRIF